MPYANNNGVKIYYEVEGQGQPLMMQHGIGDTLDFWRNHGYAKELNRDYQLILVDARGHGRSDKPHDDREYRSEIIAGDYVAILDDMGIEKTHYLGYSLGGRMGFKCLARHALSRFHSLILGGPTPYGAYDDEERRRIEQGIANMQMIAENGIEARVARLEEMYGPLRPETRARQLANDARALFSLQKAIAGWPSAEDILAGITIPCLLYAGENDSRYVGAKEASRHMPNTTFVSFPGLNHLQCYNRSDLVLPHIKEFLARVSKNLGKT